MNVVIGLSLALVGVHPSFVLRPPVRGGPDNAGRRAAVWGVARVESGVFVDVFFGYLKGG